MTTGVYRIHCSANDTYYVGESIKKHCRIKQHINALKRGEHENEHMQRAWDKYGSSAFSYRWVWLCPAEIEDVLSRHKLSRLTRRIEADVASAMIDNGFKLFNIKPFDKWDDANPTTNKETAKKVSEAAKNRWRDPEIREKMTNIIRGFSKRPEFKAARSAFQKEHKNRPEVKQFYSDAAKRQWANPETRAKLMAGLEKSRFKKPVICVETGELFESASAASRSIGKRNTAVITAIWAGKRCGGFTWRYCD